MPPLSGSLEAEENRYPGLPCLVVMPPPSSTTSVHGPLGLSDPGPRTTELRQRLSGSDGGRGASISRRSLYRPLRCSTWCSTLVVYSGALPLVVSSLALPHPLPLLPPPPSALLYPLTLGPSPVAADYAHYRIPMWYQPLLLSV
ncbi:hypothetical protein PRIPAC_73686 [Pristionchus pacificus]|uniref:Uncharacterized protein n=1 Tax=Pristionchus pacificus TaxID=54126 RepID=A0A2A6BF01_PRIPA|nr:hypothetical protein PRIPAC_73686 [Pristionchus pacificus]|eukprot:PDM64436.1 hypothetical protein PRIPAC_52692 [Pristionchus pacificus]